jgi:hypothetical protein
MHLCQELQKHADDCRRTAKTTKDPIAKATWNAMAERWAKAAATYSQTEQQVDALRRARFRRGTVHASHSLEA